MKNKLLMFSLSAATLVTPALADVSIEITGATAFRESALRAIRSLYSTDYAYGHNKAAGLVYTSDDAIFVGTVTGISGITTIRTSFKGSVEGLRAITSTASADQRNYILPTLLGAAGNGGGVNGGAETHSLTATDKVNADYSFSDVLITSTPFGSIPVLPSANSPVGVVVFTMATNEGSPVTNVTSQNFRALLARGYQPASLFTGVAADTGTVVAVGRNDGSGTRTSYLAESGYGITNTVNQYYVSASTGDQNDAFHLTEAGGTYKSTIWGQDSAGNGGYASGGDIKDLLKRTSKPLCALVDELGDEIQSPTKLDVVTWISLTDYISARGLVGGAAKMCAYNGVSLDGVNADIIDTVELTTADLEKITKGAYTAWGNQQLYRRNTLSTGTDEQKYFDLLVPAIDSNLGVEGVKSSLMSVFRSTDGGVVGP